MLNSREILTVLAPAMIFVLCLVVMIAWISGIQWPIYLGTESAMQFNTALSLSMLSMAVLIGRYFHGLSRLLAFLVLTLSFLTLVQYAFGLDLAIDHLFVVEDAVVFPGRMSIMTSICLCILSFKLMRIITWTKKTIFPIMVMMSLPLSLAIIALIGYVLNIETAYSWFGMREMAPHTALFVLILVLAIVAKRESYWSKLGSHKVYLGVTLSIGVAVIIGLSAAEYRVEERVAQNYLSSSALSIEKDISHYQQSLLLKAENSARFFETNKPLLEKEMTTFVDQTVLEIPSLIAFLVVQDDQLIWQGFNQSQLDQVLTQETFWPKLKQKLQDQNNLVDNARPFLIEIDDLSFPLLLTKKSTVFNDQTVDLILVSNVKHFFEQLSKDIRIADAFIKVELGQKTFFDQSPADFDWDQRTQHFIYPLGTGNVKINLAINTDESRQYLSHIWYLFLVSGFSVLFLVIVVFYFYLQNKNYRIAVSSWHSNLEKTFRNMNVAILAVNVKGEISLVNDNTIELFGYTEEELIGQKVEMLVPPSIAGTHPKYRAKFMEGDLSRPMENNDGLFGYKKNGDIVPLDIGLGKVQNSEEIAVVLTIVDQTMRREAQEKINQYTDELEQKNVDLANFSRILSHDLRDPIGRIITLTEMIEIYIKSNSHEKALEYVQVIEQSADYAQNLITQLYNHISKGADFSLQLCSVDSLIKLAVNTTNGLADSSKVKVSIDAEQNLKVDANGALIVQVLNNLIANALKYNDKDKAIVQITARLKEEDNMVIFGVADNGPGVPPEYTQSIFNLFDRGSADAQTSASGMGLGLATCKKIVEAHKGKIWIDVTQEDGASFYFTIPAHI